MACVTKNKTLVSFCPIFQNAAVDRAAVAHSFNVIAKTPRDVEYITKFKISHLILQDCQNEVIFLEWSFNMRRAHCTTTTLC